MAANHIADSSFFVALLTERDRDHDWAVAQAARHPRPWKTCEAALSEGFYMLGSSGMGALTALIERGSVVSAFDFGAHANDVLQLMTRYSNVPMAFAHACLVRMSEILSDPILLTTDSDFRVYRRNGRQVVPCVMPR